jgi:hypothetical protein
MRVHKPAAILFAMTVGLTGCISGIFSGMTKELREHGVSAEATILKVWDTGWTVNDGPVIGMRVEVRPSDGPAFEATIKKTLISRIDIPQFQPGTVVPVRFDPKDRTVVAVDFGGGEASAGAAASGGSGNPYRDRYVRASLGATFLPSPPAPEVYLGTADKLADEIALVENGYAIIGASAVEGGADLEQAVAQGKEVGAAVVVVYGHFDLPAGSNLDVLPYRARPRATAGSPAASTAAGHSIVPALAATERLALYFGKMRPSILGVGLRALDDREKSQLGRKGGIAVVAVTEGSPAAAAHIQAGDIIVAIDGHAIVDLAGTPALLASVAGRTVSIDLVRAGSPVSVTARLNSAAP